MERKTDRETEVGVLLNNGERDRERETEVEVLLNNGEIVRERETVCVRERERE